MKRRLIAFLVLLLAVLLLLSACGEKKIVHCDRCGKEIKISASSNMNDDWIIYCSACEKELGLDKIIEKD